MPTITLTVNGKTVTAEAPPQQLLADFLRQTLGLTGTHIGCDTTQCGACTIHLDGHAAKSCTVLAVQADGSSVTTIEGMADQKSGQMHAVQAAFRRAHGLQCGYCTPGMVMALSALLQVNPDPSEQEVRHWLEGNICRCTGYHNIVQAALIAAKALREDSTPLAVAAE